jgi:hypothetical protein
MISPKGADMPRVIASWVERFATRLIQLQPAVKPLDAVRHATSVFADASNLAPEIAAEKFMVAADGAGSHPSDSSRERS